MAAGQQKKRLHASSVVSCDLQDHCGTKKKKNVVSPHNFLNMKAHISLVWDENQQKVVAKGEQIGITWRKLGPFINPLPHRRTALADVFSIPQEIFELEDMTWVLSYEVWEAQLSETEKSFLTQFLPKGEDAEQVVQALLTGENLHFGNPFLKWGAALCSGKLHPDAILCQEEKLAVYKKAYDLELQKYHNEYLNDNMVENLQKVKETWMSREGPEKDIVEKMWREGYSDKCGNISTASERDKVIASSRKKEKQQQLYVRSGDSAKYMSYIKITRKQHQLVKEIKHPDGINSKCLNHVLGDIRSFRVQPYEIYEEEERKKLHEHWLQLANRDLPSAFANWTERLLQRQHWKRSLEQEMKGNEKSDYENENGSPNSLLQGQRDIGDADKAVMDTQGFEDEESTHSSNSMPLLRIPSLNGHHEVKPMITEFKEGIKEIFKRESVSPVLSKFVGETNPTEPLERIPSHNGHHEIEPMSTDSDEGSQEIFKPEGASPVLPKVVGERNSPEVTEQKSFLHSAEGSDSYSTNSRPLQRIPSLNGHHELNAWDMELGASGQDTTKPDGAIPIVPQFAGNINATESAVEHQVCLSSAKDPWLEVGYPDSYYHHTPINHGCTSSSELSLGQPHFIRERPAQLVDLETDLINGDAKETLLRKPSDDMRSGFHIDTLRSFSSSYGSQDHNEFFQPFLRRQDLVPSQSNGHKQVGLQFLGTHNMLLETGHHLGHLQEQQRQLLEQRQQTRDRGYYMQQVTHKNMYSNSGRYSTPSQELFSSVNMQNWAVDTTQGSTHLQALSVGRELLSENTSPVEHRARGGWSAVDVSSSSQCLGNGSNADGSLYSVLSQFNKPQSGSYNLLDTCEQGVGPRNIVGSGIASNGDVFPLTSHQLNYLSGHEAASAAVMKANNISWMNLQHQNSGLHDSIGKPFLRSWNL